MNMVSIVCLTYNQEDHIREAIDSFLMQKTNFKFEIVIHDDASTDSTPQILEEYKMKYPDIIRIIRQKENLYSKQNLLYIYKQVIDSCKSKYISYCEGDDYYIDPYKIQKQVDFLEKNPSYVMVHTGYKKFRNEKNRFSKFDSTKQQIPEGDIFEDILICNKICSASTLFCTKLAQDALHILTPIAFERNWQTADYPLWLHFSTHGKIGYIKDVCTVYRYHKYSISNKKNKETFINFLCSVKDIKEYFISISSINKQIAKEAIAYIICDIYRHTIKHKSNQKEKFRKLFLEYADFIDDKKLAFFAKYPFLDRFYR